MSPFPAEPPSVVACRSAEKPVNGFEPPPRPRVQAIRPIEASPRIRRQGGAFRGEREEDARGPLQRRGPSEGKTIRAVGRIVAREPGGYKQGPPALASEGAVPEERTRRSVKRYSVVSGCLRSNTPPLIFTARITTSSTRHSLSLNVWSSPSCFPF